MTRLVRTIAVTIAALLASASTDTRQVAPTNPTFALHNRAATPPHHPAADDRSPAPQRHAAPPSLGHQGDFSPAIATAHHPALAQPVAPAPLHDMSFIPSSPRARSLLEPAGIVLLGVGTLVLLRRRLRY